MLFFAGALAGLAGADEARREPPPPRFAGLCEPAKPPQVIDRIRLKVTKMRKMHAPLIRRGRSMPLGTSTVSYATSAATFAALPPSGVFV